MSEQPLTIARQPVVLTQPATLDHIAAIASEEDERVTPNMVARIIAAYHALHEGDPLGTIRRDPETGAVAIRIEESGYHMWRISDPDGQQYGNTEPTLPWPLLYDGPLPERKVDAPVEAEVVDAGAD
jgi:hypothetical protein